MSEYGIGGVIKICKKGMIQNGLQALLLKIAEISSKGGKEKRDSKNGKGSEKEKGNSKNGNGKE